MKRRHADKERIDAKLDYAMMITIIHMLEGAVRMLKTELDRSINRNQLINEEE